MRKRLTEFRQADGYSSWERWTEWPLIVLALIFLLVLILPLAEPLSPTVSRGLDLANVVIWGLFAANYLILLYLAQSRGRYVRTHVLDLIVVVVPFLRPFRLLRLVALVASTTRRAGGQLVQRVTVFVACAAAIILASGAVVVFDAEKSAPDRNIKTLGDAFWWAFSTVTTVGYGDRYPVTPLGRAVAAALMVTGIALAGTITAAVASWFVQSARKAAADEERPLPRADAEVASHLAQLRTSVEGLRAELADLRRQVQLPPQRQ